MKTLFSFACVALLLASCGNVKKLKVGEIRSLHFEYSPGAEINFGSTVEARIMAIMHNGDERDITNHRKLDFISTGIHKSGKNFTITHHPSNFDEDFVTIRMSVSDKEETFEARDTVRMNFLGGLTIDGSGDWGQDGEDQKDRGDRILLRDGKEGYDGTNGQPGFGGGNYEVYLWKEGDLYFIHVRDLNNSLTVWKYKTRATSTVLFNISGGRGGDGGGGDGKDGSKDDDGKMKRPGDGGNGGHGGLGGNGGNGGSLNLFIHTNASDISSQLTYNVSGGAGGEGGKGGKGGNAGDALSGQAGGSNGGNGRLGTGGLTEQLMSSF